MRLRGINIVIAFLLSCLFISAHGQLAAMTIDLGTQFLKIGIVKPGIPMDIALNTESRRKTPNVLMIQDGHRTFADAAIGMQVRYPHLVHGQLNDLVAKSYDHPSFELFKKRNTFYDFDDAPRNASSINFKLGGESYSVEALTAMILANAKKFTEEYAQVVEIKDAVITVPVYFTPAERLAVERAAQMAGLTVLQLMNDGTAAALSHGIFRRKEITEKRQTLMIYDMGAAKTTATIVEFKLVKEKYEKQPKMTVLGVGYDRTLGGIEMTNRLRDHLIELFEKTYKPKTKVNTNRRALTKFAKEAERLKQVLSANAEHFAQIESAHEDIDAKLKVTREDFNRLIADLEPRFGEPIEQALRMAQIPIGDVDQFVLMGAGTRVPKVQEAVQKTIGEKEIGKFLNTDEAIAMGALFQAAHLSKGFKVKPFNVEEKLLFPVEVHFVSKTKDEKTGELVEEKNVVKTLFAANSVYPTNPKTISLTSYSDDFTISLKYGNIESLTKKQIREIGHLLDNFIDVEISGLSEALKNRSSEESEFKGVKVSFLVDASGIVRIRRAEALFELKSGIVGSIASKLSGLFSSKTEEGEPTTDDTAETATNEEKTEEKETLKVEEPAPESKPSTNATADKIPNANETEEAVVSGNKTEQKEKKKELPSIVRLRVINKYPSAYVPNRYDVNEEKQRMMSFAEKERLAAERAAAENELESFSFECSQYLEESEFTDFTSDEEKEKLDSSVKRIRAWLEDEVTKDTPTKEFTDNLLELKNVVRTVKRRQELDKTVPEKMKSLESLLETTLSLTTLGNNVDEEKALFKKEDRDALRAKLDKLKIWVEDVRKHLDTKKKTDDFNFTGKDIDTKIKNLNREVDRFMKKMKKITTLEDLEKGGKIDIDDIAAEAEKKKSSNKQQAKSDKPTNSESLNESEPSTKTEL
uniref:Hypoxia up-regulated protein 1 n=1 Tax=Caenorhabditis tropicalis TaxID=1561998 RepID=A0A1I7TTG8_9PELO